MKSFDYDAVVIDGEVYCVECAPEVPDEDVVPIFADSEWQDAPVCCECSATHDYVQVLVQEDAQAT